MRSFLSRASLKAAPAFISGLPAGVSFCLGGGNVVSLALRAPSSCRALSSFIVGLFSLYEDLFFTYLEINPLGRFSILMNSLLPG